MRKIAFAVAVTALAFLTACERQQTFNYTAEDANEDAALNTLQAENNDAQGASDAVLGMIPDENGTMRMANVQ
ncbi:hypothetical protein HZF05_17005 [Sphingomonas sp. CGMCC 1.13654]|uniref:Uncharacterized protein n=1 Tax=Sphingomonas chungangi TaxID=2683589 RepID=A0A838LA65_9SPHN|nr:hypothetical protein [Sphingomonas chungangi]MBA2935780.1 hypothetical protein [Sphingomonas chungangi]MVW54471.1 hypothetical protein [Sphingomonas chungangi]